MIIDVHGHVGPWPFDMDDGGPDQNLRLMDYYGIGLQMVSSVEAIVDHARTGNENLARMLPEYAGRLAGLLVIDPRRLSDAEDCIGRYVADGWFVGVKIHSSYSETPIASRRMRAALELAAAYRLPALVHTWGPDLVDLAEVTAAIPGARTIAGHTGAGSWRLAAAAHERTDRIFFEPSWSMPAEGRMRWLLDEVGIDALLFGSDSSLIDPAVSLGAIAAAQLTAAQWRQLSVDNAIDLFDLTGSRFVPELRKVAEDALQHSGPTP